MPGETVNAVPLRVEKAVLLLRLLQARCVRSQKGETVNAVPLHFWGEMIDVIMLGEMKQPAR